MNQTNHFFDLGYGWLCKHCSAEDAERKHTASHSGSQDDNQIRQHAPGLALASWADSTHHTLKCPRCGIEETIVGGSL